MNAVFDDPYKLKVLNKVSLLNSFDEAYALIREECAKKQSPVVVSYINAHGYNLCNTDPDFYKAMSSSDFIFRDGKGVEILFKSIGKEPGVNFCGTDSIPFFIQRWPGKRIALIGTEDPYLQRAADKLQAAGFEIVLTRNGFLPLDAYMPVIQESKPDLIILGMGMPKQEQLSYLISQSVDYGCLVINGGAVIDYLGGKVKRAPRWMRQMGMEWVFRFMLEPKRMFKRYVVGNVIFLVAVKRLKKELKSSTKLY
jgi:exopolysaccharide biosynthesis WecB/TagA/CpsF family protein